MEVGKYIKYLRTKKGISQEELGKIVGVQRAAVQKWESGLVQNLKRTTIKKLAEYFCVNPAYFVTDEIDDLLIDITTHEREVIAQYRAKPHLQGAVDKLLDVCPESEGIGADIAQELKRAAKPTAIK